MIPWVVAAIFAAGAIGWIACLAWTAGRAEHLQAASKALVHSCDALVDEYERQLRQITSDRDAYSVMLDALYAGYEKQERA